MTTRLHMVFWLSLCLLAVVFLTMSPEEEPISYRPAPFLMADKGWVDSTWRRMDENARLGEIFMVVADYEEIGTQSLDSLIADYPVGGILFRNYPAAEQIRITQLLQQQRGNSLLIGVDASKISSDYIQLPTDLSLAAIRNDSLLQEVAHQSAQQIQAYGIDLALIPSQANVLTAENQTHLINHLNAINHGYQQENILLCATGAMPYFPFEHDSSKLEQLLAPYDQLSRSGFAAMMIDGEVIDRIHLNSQKKQIIQTYVGKQISYQGLLFGELDDNYGAIEDQVRKMLKSGIDLMLVHPDQLSEAMATVKDLRYRRFFSDEELEENAHKLLLAKSWIGKKSFKEDSLTLTDINYHHTLWNNRRLETAKLTLVKNSDHQIPISELREKATHLLVIGEEMPGLLARMRTYGPVSNSQIALEENQAIKPLNPEVLAQFRPVVLALNEIKPDPLRDAEFLVSLKEVQKRTDVVLLNFGSLETLEQFEDLASIIQAYDNDELNQELVAQVMWGGVEPQGQLPIRISDRLTYGLGEKINSSRLAFSVPEEVAIASMELNRIDSIVMQGIHEYAMPGCQILVAKQGKVIYNRSFGHHTYAKKRRVYPTDLYDLASVTKVAATTVASMKMQTDDRLHPEDRLASFFRDRIVIVDSVSQVDSMFVHKDSLPVLNQDSSPFVLVSQRRSRRGEMYSDTTEWGDSLLIVNTWKMGRMKRRGQIFDLKIGELLTHHSGLPAGLPILPFLDYQDSLVGRYDRYYHYAGDSIYSIQVAGNFFMRQDYWDTLWTKTKAINVSPKKAYEYSDANMILVQQVIDSINKESMDLYLNREVYERLGMQNTSFNPRHWCEPERIIPTSYDGKWRGQLLRGYVHDPTAALLGGVSGNAGLFSNAQDLAHLFQMVLNEGHYGGERYLKPEVVRQYTRRQGGHRGYGFDKPPTYRSDYIIGSAASLASYGHTGFTGTCIWVDPEQELIYIFLSNRVHPKSGNWTLNELQIRQRIHDVIYEAIELSDKRVD